MYNPFEIPNIVQDKIQLDEIIELLRQITDKGYMPSSMNESTIHSKPEFSRGQNKDFPNFPRIELPGVTDFYTFDDYFYKNVLYKETPTDAVFKYIAFKNVEMIINLRTLETIVKSVEDINSSRWYQWLPGPDYAIAIDNYINDINTFG